MWLWVLTKHMMGALISAAVFFLLKSVQKSAHVFSNAFLEKSKTYLDVKMCGKY